MIFQRGDEIEVSSGEQGYLGSYYEAILSTKIINTLYIVEYNSLINYDGSRPLRDVNCIKDIKPRPPIVPFPAEDLSTGDKVDSYDNDGWWSGTICEKKESGYVVHFHTTGQTITFPETD
ncbi:DUF724 domain-containing protein 6-like, partial [Carica papaya]|uniref:DUF724 domain-containing protein 6-like n=1 Tax=Carica papaya TaxID=3649 RepID=UPI000B8CDB9F